MKTKILYFFLISFLFCSLSCNNTSDAKNKKSSSYEDKDMIDQKSDPAVELRELRQYLDEEFIFQDQIPQKFDFCNDAILKDGRYNRVSGIANFTIPIPKGSNIISHKKTGDTLVFVCDGNGNVNYDSKNLIGYDKTKTGLTRGDFSKKLYVAVVFQNFIQYSCATEEFLQTKKKTSEVSGHPFTK